MIREIIKKIKEKKQEKLEKQSTPEIKIGMSVCVAKFDVVKDMQIGVVGCVVGKIYHDDTYLVKFEDGSVDCYDADAICTDYNKELLK